MSRLHQRLLGLRHRVLFTDAPDPGILQGVFAVLFVLDLSLRGFGGSSLELNSWPMAGLVLTGVTCVLALAVPWAALPAWAVGVLPLLDLAALGMSRMDVAGGGAGLLAVVPALWLGREFRRWGAVAAVVGTALLLALPSLLYLGVTGVNLTRAVLIPVAAGWAAFAISSAVERVQSSLDVIEHQRRASDAILDTADVGLVLLDSAGHYERMNRRHEAFMRIGYPDGHAGQAGQLGQVFGPDGSTPLTRDETPTWRASHGEEFDHSLLWIGSDPLTNRAVSVSARQVRGEHGESQGAALAYHDVTEFMRALRIKGEFVASVSHELRTPLTSISGYVHLLLERDDLPDEVMAQLEVVDRNSQRLGRLVEDLLLTAQAEERPMRVDRSPTDLAAIVCDAVEAAGPSADRAGVTVAADVPSSLNVSVDAARMAQVLDNLLSNAIKYSTAGGHVRVTLGSDADRVELTVADDGIGIAAADRDRLFRKFFRTQQAEERSIQGVGLGLSITKSIVESHGGRIDVESEVGRGSVFRVRIPL